MRLVGNAGFGGWRVGRLRLIAAAVLLLGVSAAPASADPAITVTTLADRAQIEDMLVDYYGQLGAGRHDFGHFYVPDGVLDVNGIVAQGKEPIEDLYKKIAQGSPLPAGTFRMLLTNIRIVVDGDTGTADMIWTGVNSPTVKAAPQFVEQGREHDDLVKRDGHWYFKKRVITSDGGLPAMFEKTYKKR
jgi:hypothetical protein